MGQQKHPFGVAAICSLKAQSVCLMEILLNAVFSIEIFPSGRGGTGRVAKACPVNEQLLSSAVIEIHAAGAIVIMIAQISV